MSGGLIGLSGPMAAFENSARYSLALSTIKNAIKRKQDMPRLIRLGILNILPTLEYSDRKHIEKELSKLDKLLKINLNRDGQMPKEVIHAK